MTMLLFETVSGPPVTVSRTAVLSTLFVIVAVYAGTPGGRVPTLKLNTPPPRFIGAADWMSVKVNGYCSIAGSDRMLIVLERLLTPFTFRFATLIPVPLDTPRLIVAFVRFKLVTGMAVEPTRLLSVNPPPLM